ncbi:ankyrin repeat domain-containing protein [Shewanella sp. VB17]|uniref:ankyrin repeat domain-containing protein n=1 Tax=Shewanella sp. VB17 TaxID=2739432 RepID=UPI001564B160|nr:ankyrin repeat domain-containing protein [Shewanella sp. VB17]NRD74942.1 ankyrin repeat domain-containing protein [Shewanella sp. VB17]
MKKSFTIKSILITISVPLAVFFTIFCITYYTASASVRKQAHEGDKSAYIEPLTNTAASVPSSISFLDQTQLTNNKDEGAIKATLLNDYFFAAARTGNVEVIHYFAEAGFPVDQRNSQSYTALMVSAYNGQEQAIEALLNHGANACLQDKRGNTAIMGAVIKAEFAIMKQLYRQDCDAKLTNKSGMTLEEFAQYWGQSQQLQKASLAAKQQM